jgi:hypothetical protein
MDRKKRARIGGRGGVDWMQHSLQPACTMQQAVMCDLFAHVKIVCEPRSTHDPAFKSTHSRRLAAQNAMNPIWDKTIQGA